MSHTVCDRIPMLSAARKAPSTIIRPDADIAAGARRRSPSAAGRCRHQASSRQAWAASAHARPGRSLIGRTARYQNNGHDAAMAAAPTAAMSSERHGARSASWPALPRQVNCPYMQDDREDPAPASESTASARASIAEARRAGAEPDDGRRDLAERDVDGITRRVRAMRRDVEVAHAEREVDRIDVFERRGEKRDVREREDQRQSAPASRWRLTKPVAGGAPRSGFPGGSPADRG